MSTMLENLVQVGRRRRHPFGAHGVMIAVPVSVLIWMVIWLSLT